MGTISPGTVEGTLILGVFVLLLGALIVGMSEPDSRAWSVTCVAGTLAALLSWLLLFRFLFGGAA